MNNHQRIYLTIPTPKGDVDCNVTYYWDYEVIGDVITGLCPYIVDILPETADEEIKEYIHFRKNEIKIKFMTKISEIFDIKK